MADRESGLPPNDRRVLEALRLFSNKWSPVVVLALRRRGPQGFSELLDGIPGVSSKVLSETLKEVQASGLVERRVVSESPLRVEYERTEAGRELEPVFESLAEWADTHLETAAGTVLLADSDRRITGMYQQWLEDRYSVVRAHDGEELGDRFDDRVDILLLDADLPGMDPQPAVTGFDRRCRTVLVVGDRPSLELLSVNCDDVLRKPFVRETMLETVADQIARLDEPAVERERASLEARASLFESIYPREQLETHAAYREVVERLEALAASD